MPDPVRASKSGGAGRILLDRPAKLNALTPQMVSEMSAVLDAWERDVTQEGITVFRQDRTGAVGVIMRDGRFEARAFLGGQIFFSRAR